MTEAGLQSGRASPVYVPDIGPYRKQILGEEWPQIVAALASTRTVGRVYEEVLPARKTTGGSWADGLVQQGKTLEPRE